MRTIWISLAATASALAVASPAAAQWAPPPPPGYAYGYNGQGYGYGRVDYGQVRAFQARINGLQRLINQLDRRDAIRDREANRLRASSRDIERRLQRSARYGLNPREAYSVQRRIAQLEQRIHHVLNDGRRWGRNDRRWNSFWTSYDRDARNDRWDRDDDDRDDRRGRRGRDRD